MIRANAVLGKELRTRMRGWRAAIVVTAYLAILAAISLIFLSGNSAPTTYRASADLGQGLFSLLAGFQLSLIIFVTPASTANAISGERQRQTLDLLLVTRLSSLAIVLGKLLAGLAFDILLILCTVPLFSLVFILGGVSPSQFLSMFATFLVTTVLLGSMALYISTITRRSGAAIVISLLCTLGLTIGLGLLSLYLLGMDVTAQAGSIASSIPLPAYFDPILGFVAALPSSTDWNTTIDHITAGPLNLTVWQDQMIVDVILSLLFVLGSVRLLRQHWSSR